MCFMLYAGTTAAIPRKSFDQNSPDISVQDLNDDEQPIKPHFKKPKVQNIGSTSNCGCDFPWTMLQGDAWPEMDDVERDDQRAASDRFNRLALVTLLKSVEDESVELYGVWAGDYAKEPRKREEISIDEILDPHFRFRERCFCEVRLSQARIQNISA